MNNQKLIERDLILYGTAFTVGGKYVDFKDVVMYKAPDSSNNEPSKEIAEHYKAWLEVHGTPKEICKDPSTGKLYQNSVFIPVVLLNKLLRES